MKRIKPTPPATPAEPVGAAEAAAFARKACSEHTVTLHRTITTSVTVVANDEGNAQIVESDGEDVLNYLDSHLVCEECGGPLYTHAQLTAHGFSPEWSES